MHIDLQTFLRSRRSIRRFKRTRVSDSVVDRILLTAVHAPSAHNLQPWRIVKIVDFDNKIKLGTVLTSKMKADLLARGGEENEIEARAKRSLKRLTEAPLVVLLCRETTSVKGQAPEEDIMAIQSVAVAGLQLLLAAHAEGLGGNWICWPLYAAVETIKALSLPDTWDPQAMFFIGYPDESPLRRESIPLEELVLSR